MVRAWKSHTEPQMFCFLGRLRANPQVSAHCCLLVSSCFSFPHLCEADVSPMNFAGAVTEEFMRFPQPKYHFAQDFTFFNAAEVPVYEQDEANCAIPSSLWGHCWNLSTFRHKPEY